MTTEKEYINGCYTRYGKRPLEEDEIIQHTTLHNGMYAVCGISKIKKDGVSIDVYKNPSKKELVFMEHGITISDRSLAHDPAIFFLAESRCSEMGI